MHMTVTLARLGDQRFFIATGRVTWMPSRARTPGFLSTVRLRLWSTLVARPPGSSFGSSRMPLDSRSDYPAGLNLVGGNELRERLSGRAPPADAKWMPGRVRVHLVALGGIEIRSWLEQPGTEGDCLFMRGSRVVDVEVEMNLLGSPVRPAGRNMVRRQLHADPPLSGGVDDAVPIVVLEDVPAEHACPERTLGMEVSRIEHDHLTHHVHDTHTTGASANWTISLGMSAAGWPASTVAGGLSLHPTRARPDKRHAERDFDAATASQ